MTPIADKLSAATRLMTQGGDERIRLDPATWLNRYHSAPAPSPVLAFASSTANDISADAFVHVARRGAEIGPAPGARKASQASGTYSRSVPEGAKTIAISSSTP